MNISVFNKYVQHIMTKLNIDTGTLGNPATGDTLRTAMTKANSNFDELYIGLSQTDDNGGLITTEVTNGDMRIQPNGTGVVEIDQLQINSDSITSLVTNGDVTLAGNGTGNVIVEALTINGTTLSSADSTLITVAEALEVTGAATLGTSLTLATGATVTGILDEDAMGTNSATQLATQQSIKAYVDSTVTAQDLDVASDSGTAAVDLDSQSLTVTGGTGIGTTATGQAVTVNIDATVATLAGSQTLTNKTLSGPTINTINATTFTANASADIVLDAGGGDVKLKDSGTLFATFTNNGGNLTIKNSATTALTFSGANVTAAGNLTVDGNLDVTGTLDLSDSDFTNAGALQLDSIAGD